jgi:hypothetical protein
MGALLALGGHQRILELRGVEQKRQHRQGPALRCREA